MNPTPTVASAPAPSLLPVLNARVSPMRTTLPIPLGLTLGVGLVLGLAFDGLFDGHALGVSVPLFVLMMLGALELNARRARERVTPAPRLLSVLALCFASMVAVRASPLLTTCNLVAAMVLTLLAFELQRPGRQLRGPGVGGALLLGVRALAGGGQGVPLLALAAVSELNERRRLPLLVRVFKGSLLAVPILTIFFALLASADAVFRARAEGLVETALGLASPLRLAVALTSGALLAGLLIHAHVRRPEQPVSVRKGPSPYRLGDGEGIALLALLDLLFAAFVVSQAVQASSPSGVFSEQARQGFFQLLAVTLLTLGVLMAVIRFCRFESRSTRGLFLLAASAMVLLVLGIVGVAVRRMTAYEEAYGYTELRVYSHVFIFLVAAVLGFRWLTLFWKKEAFTVSTGLLPLVALLGLNVLNPDAFIAGHDVLRAKPDWSYLAELSEDATPVLAAALLPGCPGSSERCFAAEPVLQVFKARGGKAPDAWPATHLARDRARRMRDRRE